MNPRAPFPNLQVANAHNSILAARSVLEGNSAKPVVSGEMQQTWAQNYKLPASSTPLRFQVIYLYCSFSLRYETTAKPMGNKLPATIKHHPAKSLGRPILPQRTHYSVRKFPMLLLLPLQVQSSPKKTCFFLVLPYTMISEPPKKTRISWVFTGGSPMSLVSASPGLWFQGRFQRRFRCHGHAKK